MTPGEAFEAILRWARLLVPFKRITGGLKEHRLYRPRFSPWRDPRFLREMEPYRPFTLVSADRLYVLKTLVLQAIDLEGEIWECGVYRGGTAMLLSALIASKGPADGTILRLFDTFEGMPATDPERDFHRKGEFSETSLQSVRKRLQDVPNVRFHAGMIPETFRGLEKSRIAFAHIDVDIFRSVIDCCEFIYPRMVPGGFILFDDYGFPSCPGAREAVDQFFADKPAPPLVLATGQALAIISPRSAAG